jgi:selenocysteine-specific elongation factor
MKHIVVGTAGHIDHGKSALVLALTGTDPDRLKEEKARGITIELGFAHWEAPGVNVAFVDVPGHERFVKNMLAGAGGVDAVMLVVAADESVMPQTREHFEICRLLRVQNGLIVLTKADLVDADMIALVGLEVRELVKGSFLADAPLIAASSRTGKGLDAVREALIDLGQRVPGRSADGPVRLPIDRVFSMRGFGTVVTGTLVSGRLATEMDCAVLPGSRAVKVRGLQVHGQRLEVAEAGQRVAVNLAGVEVADAQRGDTLVSPGAFADTRVVDARIEVLPSARPVRHGARVRFHQGTTEVLGRVAVSGLVAVADVLDPPVAVEIPAGRSAYVRLRFEQSAVLTRGDRFIVRAYSPSVTIAGGAVIDPQPPRGGIRTASGRARYVRLDPVLGVARTSRRSGAERSPHDVAGDAETEAVLALIEESDVHGLPLQALHTRVGLGEAAAVATRVALERDGRVAVIGDLLVMPSALERLASELVQALGAYHRAVPLEDGMPREEARERLFAHAGAGVFERVLDGLVGAQQIVARDRLALASYRLALTPAEAEAKAGLERLFREAGLTPPSLAEAAASLGQASMAIEKIVSLLTRQKVLVRLDTLVFHAEPLEHLKQELAAQKAASAESSLTIDIASFKSRYGVSRKFAIPLLEYLDRERVTRRVGESRVLI